MTNETSGVSYAKIAILSILDDVVGTDYNSLVNVLTARGHKANDVRTAICLLQNENKLTTENNELYYVSDEEDNSA